MREQHVALAGSERPALAGAARLRNAPAEAPVSVTISLRGKVAEPERIPDERRADAEKTKAVLERYGLTVDEVRLEPGSIVASGPVTAMNAAFRTDLGIYRSAEQGEFRGREGELQIPAELAGVVTGVFGLDQRRVARRAAVRGSGSRGSLTPDDLEKLYSFPPGHGHGQKIGVAEFGGGYFDDDLQAFCAGHGRPAPQVDVVSLGFAPPRSLEELRQLPPQEQQEAAGATPEVMMDVQIIAGLCPEATISVYFSLFDQKGWMDLLDRTIEDRPVALSVSWGLPEDHPDWSQTARDEIDKRLAGAADRGITVCVASGDDGNGDQIPDGHSHVDFPSSSQHVLSVGGTMIDLAGREVAWWEAPGRRTRMGGGSSGGGVSTLFERPQWQQSVQVDSLNPGSIKGRIVPDVAALAGSPFYDLTLVGRPAPNGGTSASAPLWAALIARINATLPVAKQQRFLTPLLYRNGSNGRPLGQAACRDIATGHSNNSHPPAVGYPVKAGFDAVTGWGVPDGNALLKGLQ
ncbi:S53 family peptidase [Streptomyces sp. NPDC002138]|uniref:S53 family peptidase n=1 Tax=Streptomyces sp. NPDC002138 TaxID=3154410 RepID=UPI00332FCA5B